MDSCSVGLFLEDKCHKISYCLKTGFFRSKDFEKNDKKLIELRTGIFIFGDNICFHKKVSVGQIVICKRTILTLGKALCNRCYEILFKQLSEDEFTTASYSDLMQLKNLNKKLTWYVLHQMFLFWEKKKKKSTKDKLKNQRKIQLNHWNYSTGSCFWFTNNSGIKIIYQRHCRKDKILKIKNTSSYDEKIQLLI